MTVVDKEKYLDLFDGDAKVRTNRDKATSAVRRGDAAKAVNKKVRDARAAYLATLPEWLREMSS